MSEWWIRFRWGCFGGCLGEGAEDRRLVAVFNSVVFLVIEEAGAMEPRERREQL